MPLQCALLCKVLNTTVVQNLYCLLWFRGLIRHWRRASRASSFDCVQDCSQIIEISTFGRPSRCSSDDRSDPNCSPSIHFICSLSICLTDWHDYWLFYVIPVLLAVSAYFSDWSLYLSVDRIDPGVLTFFLPLRPTVYKSRNNTTVL